MSESSGSVAPYGPGTSSVRAFLVRFAGLGASDRARVLERFHAARAQRAWQLAERALGDTIERSGRESERDALAGPLLQLVKRADAADATDDELSGVDPIAEPALAALLALVVRDLLTSDQFTTLYAPFADVIPFVDANAR